MMTVASWSIRRWDVFLPAPVAKPAACSSSTCPTTASLRSHGRIFSACRGITAVRRWISLAAARREHSKAVLAERRRSRILSKIACLTAMILAASPLLPSRTLCAAENAPPVLDQRMKEWVIRTIKFLMERLEYDSPYQERWGSVGQLSELIHQYGGTADIISDDQIDSLAASAEKFEGDPLARLVLFEAFNAIGPRAQRVSPAMERIYIYEFCHTKIPAQYNSHGLPGLLSQYPPGEMSEIIERIKGAPPPRPDCEPPL
jgi:hypothetical protein